MRDAWNKVSANYQARHQIATNDVHYGPWAPPERELRLLGDVHGRHVLELGCGGGQCCVALAKRGAIVIGVDLSDAQLAFARNLATQEKVNVEFIQGSATNLAAVQDNSCDLVLSIYTFPYIGDIQHCLTECYRVLRPKGQLIFSLDHPLHDCFFDPDDEELALYPVRNYFDTTPMHWFFADTGVRMQSQHYTITQWLTMIQQNGFQLGQCLEPLPSTDLLDDLWPSDSPYAPLRNLPQTIIFGAEKPLRDQREEGD